MVDVGDKYVTFHALSARIQIKNNNSSHRELGPPVSNDVKNIIKSLWPHYMSTIIFTSENMKDHMTI